MSRRERLRRRRNGGAASNGNATASSAGGRNSAAPPAIVDALRPTEADDATVATPQLEVEVPIGLGTEPDPAAALPKAGVVEGVVTSDAGAAGPASAPARPPLPPSSADRNLEVDVRRRLMDRLQAELLGELDDEARLAARIREVARAFLSAGDAPLAASRADEIIDEFVRELAGLGPIEPLIRDPTVTDILVNGANDIYVERGGRMTRVNASFRDDAHLLAVIGRVASRCGRRIDAASPIVDARLPDGSRVNAIGPPLAVDGPVLSIHRFGAALDIDALSKGGALTRPMATFLAGCVRARLSILIAGGAGSGKTTLLNALGALIPRAERVATIEAAAELRLEREQLLRLETRPPSSDGHGEVTARDLVRNALRMRPHRLIIGEVRGAEAMDLLQAMHVGHEGSMATIHATSPTDALARLENMALLAGGLPARAVREHIAATIDVVVHVARLADGRRRLVSITEVTGIEDGVITMSEIFAFRPSGVPGATDRGWFEATGMRPRVAERLQVAGVALPNNLFDRSLADTDDQVAPDRNASGAGASNAGSPPPTTSRAVVAVEGERSPAAVNELEATIRRLQAALEEEKRAAERARAAVADTRAQLIAARSEVATLRDEVRAAQCDAEEQREFRAALQHRSRSLALAVTGFVDVLDDLIDAGRASVDTTVRDRASRLRESGARLLALFGVSEIGGDVGGRVDASQHEVIRRVAAAGRPPGTITEVVQRGFAYHGETIRRAQVVAAR